MSEYEKNLLREVFEQSGAVKRDIILDFFMFEKNDSFKSFCWQKNEKGVVNLVSLLENGTDPTIVQRLERAGVDLSAQIDGKPVWEEVLRRSFAFSTVMAELVASRKLKELRNCSEDVFENLINLRFDSVMPSFFKRGVVFPIKCCSNFVHVFVGAWDTEIRYKNKNRIPHIKREAFIKKFFSGLKKSNLSQDQKAQYAERIVSLVLDEIRLFFKKKELYEIQISIDANAITPIIDSCLAVDGFIWGRCFSKLDQSGLQKLLGDGRFQSCKNPERKGSSGFCKIEEIIQKAPFEIEKEEILEVCKTDKAPAVRKPRFGI